MSVDNSRIAKNTVFLYFRMLLAMGASLVTAGVVLRVLGHVDYGLYSVLAGVVAMFSFLNGALAGSASRNITFELGAGNRERLSEVFSASFYIHVVFAIVIVLLCETVGLWFFCHKMVIPEARMEAAFWVLQISFFNCAVAMIQVPYTATIIAHEDMGIYAYVSVFESLTRLLIAYLIVIIPFDKMISYAAFYIVIGLSTTIVYMIYCLRKYPESHIRLCKDKAVYVEILRYAGSDLIGNLALLAQGQGLNLLLNVFFGPVVNAARGIACSIQGTLYQFCDSFTNAVRPQITKSYAAGEEEEMWRLVSWSSGASYYLVLAIAAPVCLEAKYILTCWLGSYPEHTITFLYLVVGYCLLDILQRPIVYVLHATGKILRYNICSGTIMCCAFPLAYLFLKFGFPPEFVFVATIIVAIVGFVVEMRILKIYISYSCTTYLRETVLRCLGVTSCVVLVGILLHKAFETEMFLRVVFTGVASTFALLCTISVFGFPAILRRRAYDAAHNLFRRARR